LSRSLVRALRHTGISLIYQDLELKVVWAENVPPSWSEESLSGKTDHGFLPDGEATRVAALKENVCRTGEPQNLEISVVNGSTTHCTNCRSTRTRMPAARSTASSPRPST